MHLLITDRLICPRCGPEFGLVLVARHLEERRVREGFFGCPNCREEYPIHDGVGDLRPSPRTRETAPPLAWSDDSEEALRLAAMLGVRTGPGYLLLAGPCAGHARSLAALIEEVEVLALHPGLASAGEVEGVSRVAASSILPFRSHSLRGIVFDGPAGALDLTEATRTLGAGGRLVLFHPTREAADEIRRLGYEMLLEEDRVAVGLRR